MTGRRGDARVRRRSLAHAALRAFALASLLAVAGCARSPERPAEDGVRLDQRVTTRRVPRDAAFADFEAEWRHFVSPLPDLAKPVHDGPGGGQVAWTPTAAPQCAQSEAAGGAVPLVTLTWSDPRPPAGDAARVRLDLAVHHRGFERALYSSALLGERQERLLLPSTSALVADPDALLLTGPVLFPALVAERLGADGDPGRHEVGLRDLGEGLTYSVRLSRWRAGAWVEAGRAVVLVPVCSGGGQ